MAEVRPFRCIRPNKEVASKVAALPYDVYNRQEAKREVEKNPMSFLAADRAETQFADNVDLHDPRVYAKAKELLEQWQKEGILVSEESECYYVYELTMNGRSQTGIVACAAVDDYVNGVIKKHENTREDKEQDRICHVDVTDAHTGPIFLAYRSDEELNQLVSEICSHEALYDFTAEDGIRHRVWKAVEGSTGDGATATEAGKADNGASGEASGQWTGRIQKRFRQMTGIYIADGHHRAASAVKVGLKRRKENPEYTGEEPFNYFLLVLFPDDQLMIMPYNRVVKDLNGNTEEEFLKKVRERFAVKRLSEDAGNQGAQPTERRHIGMYLAGQWYELEVLAEHLTEDPVKGLDVSLLQDYLLAPVLGIGDPRTDARIQFVGGIRGLKELERMVDSGDGAVAFAMYPTSIQELFSVADAGLLMPPKSTWFEPKLRSGLFIHKLS
ncbi:MAG: DUF1015 domain-containing protein [Lachnospiraceae bacterium]|nr:DUF1015 domain-containing protein [Lachnospiraceae bacterium]